MLSAITISWCAAAPQSDNQKTPPDSVALRSDSVKSDTTHSTSSGAHGRAPVREEALIPLSPDSVDTQRRLLDSLLAVARHDTTVGDTGAPVVIREFWPPTAILDSTEREFGRLWSIPRWDLPALADLATGDLADWLLLAPGFDVDDAPGPGQFRRYTRWGLIDRLGTWSVDGEPFAWERLNFPQDARFDPTSLPSFEYEHVRVSDRVDVWHEAEWPLDAHSSYFLRQGDFGETYSEGRFRRRFPLALAVDLGFTFYKSEGRYILDNRDTRHLRWQVAGPLKGKFFWSLRFHQFRDRSWILTPQIYSGIQPRRDDLLYTVDALVYTSPADPAHPIFGMDLQSGKQDIKGIGGYRLESHDRTWTLWGQRVVRGWLLKTAGTIDQLRIKSVDRSRWEASVEGQQESPVQTWGTMALKAKFSGWDTDPFAPEVSAAIIADRTGYQLHPGIRLERIRVVPTLFDRYRPVDTTFFGSGQYIESGDPSLHAEWRNMATIMLVSDTARNAVDFTAEGQLTYAQHYTRWENISQSATEADDRPRSDDARTAGIALGLHTPLRWKFETWVNYAAKYAATVSGTKLTGYYPHKASVILSWIAPQFRYGIDIRLNSALIWWYGDGRALPTRYRNPHVFRWDLSGSARMKDFTFYYSIQNVANFQYRTDVGYDFTGRDVRFGINWQFLD